MDNIDALANFYAGAKNWLLSSPFRGELQWQQERCHTQVSERELLREHAWVVLNSGFRESVIRKHFDYISLCFCDWESAADIVKSGQLCVVTAKSAFRNTRKLNAILRMAEIVVEEGFDPLMARISADSIKELQRLPHIGSVTCFHLAKNLGFDVAKPDRHLERLAKFFRFTSTFEMCAHISDMSGDDMATIDLVLWRHLEQVSGRNLEKRVIRPASTSAAFEVNQEYADLVE